MGGAASLSTSQTVEVTRILREQFEILQQDQGLSDKEVWSKLDSIYTRYVQENVQDKEMGWEKATGQTQLKPAMAKTPSKLLTKKDEEELLLRLQRRSLVDPAARLARRNSASTGTLVDGPLSPPPKKGQVPARRKSFAQAIMPTICEAAVEMKASEEPVGVDSWDSVTQLPYCYVCLMAFKSSKALERHEMFSSLHSSVVQKKKDDYDKSMRKDELEKFEVEQVEGIHYKLLYAGRKLFWKSKESLDLSFYYHFNPNCVEVISFEADTTNEINRTYLSYDVLEKMSQEIIDRKEYDEREQEIRAFQTQAEKDDALRMTLTTVVLARLNPEDQTKSVYSADNKVSFRRLPTDPVGLDPLLTDIPEDAYPVHVQLRRRSSAEEIDSAMFELQAESMELRKTTIRASSNLPII
jgi:hypothetical protein